MTTLLSRYGRSRVLVALVAATLVPALLPAAAADHAKAESQATAAGSNGSSARDAAALPAYENPGRHQIRLMVGAFDPLSDPLPRQDGVELVDPAGLAAGDAAYWVVQGVGRDYAATTAAIKASGATELGYIPHGAYLVRATPEQRDAIAADAAIRWTGVFQPAWKMPVALGEYEALLDLSGVRSYLVYAFSDDAGITEAASALRNVDGVEVVQRTGRVTEIIATAAQLPAIAKISAVEWIEAKPTVVPMNMNARWVNDTGVRDVYSATAPGRLDGSGQTAGVADTGLNYIPDSQGRALSYFRDCEAGAGGDEPYDPSTCLQADYTQAEGGNSPEAMTDVVSHDTGHRKMAAYFDVGASGPEPTDDSAHGSHVAGSVTGDTAEYGTWQRADGMAPAARLVHQNVATPGGGLSTPSDTYYLFAQSYRPRNPAQVGDPANRPAGDAPRDRASYVGEYRATEDARTHNNSYGLVVPSVSLGSAEQADRFVWNNEDMFIVSSAGNSGPKSYSIGAPSIGKNVVTSGASANGRQPMVSIDSMASFSSHGPTADGRYGVDLATPGQIVVSAKGGSEDGEHYLQGTSMSGPVLTGLATLVRQYFWDGYGPGPTGGPAATASGFARGNPVGERAHNPSAALVRATMTNGAQRMRGFYTGDDGQVRGLDGQYPSAGQGFGLVNLHDSLYFDDDRGKDDLANWFHDVYRADDEAFETGATDERQYQVHVAEGEPLSVSLAYTDAPSLLPQGTPTMQNNLDLVLTAPDGTVYAGNNFNTRTNPGADEYFTVPGATTQPVVCPTIVPTPSCNPVERVRVPEPAEGTWTITVRPTDVPEGPQGFALAASGLLSEGAAAAFAPGAALQTDEAGKPTISDVAVESVNADLLKVTWSTDEPTTGTVSTTVDGETVTYIDSYNVDREDGFYGIDEAQVETSAEYGDKPMVGTRHEALLTGLSPGTRYRLQVKATDLADNTATAAARARTTNAVFGAEPPDIGQLVEDNTDPITSAVPILGGSGWKTGTQLYAGKSAGAGLLGAFMFRLPKSVNPSRIAGAAVEMVSAHNVSNLYTDDPHLYVDLLNESLEPEWGTQNYSEIHNADALARLSAETGVRRGGGKTYAFTFTCADLDQLRTTLSEVNDEGQRLAPFRFDSATESATSLFSTEFGFNRRSKGPDLRPRLVLFMDNGDRVVNPLPPAAGTPAPTISDVGVQPGLAKNSVTVSWQTDVPSNSVVLFREQGTKKFTQVGSPDDVKVHFIQVFGLDRSKAYEFAVRSTSPGGSTTDDNAGEGYEFFVPGARKVKLVPYYFHGQPTDNEQKLAQFGGETTATFSKEEPDGAVPVTQSMTGLASTSFVRNPLAAYWGGPFTGELNGPLTFDWYFSTTGAPRTAAVNVTVFADTGDETGSQPDNIVASGGLSVAVGPVPQRSVGVIDVVGTDNQVSVAEELVVQVSGAGLTDNDLLVHYDSAETPSFFGVPVKPAVERVGPKTGPIPPLSAESDGFGAAVAKVGTRTDPTKADVAAGTGFCTAAAPTKQPPPEDREPGDGDRGDRGGDRTPGGGTGPTDGSLPVLPATGGGIALALLTLGSGLLLHRRLRRRT